jgi:hypothetical protein
MMGICFRDRARGTNDSAGYRHGLSRSVPLPLDRIATWRSKPAATLPDRRREAGREAPSGDRPLTTPGQAADRAMVTARPFSSSALAEPMRERMGDRQACSS